MTLTLSYMLKRRLRVNTPSKIESLVAQVVFCMATATERIQYSTLPVKSFDGKGYEESAADPRWESLQESYVSYMLEL